MSFERLIDDGRLGIENSRVAGLAFDLGASTRNYALAVPATALIEDAARNRDVPALRALLDQCVNRLREDEAHHLGERIARLIADLTPEDPPIDDVITMVAEFVEDHRQQGDLDTAVKLATFGRANEHRADADTRSHLESVLSRLEATLEIVIDVPAICRNARPRGQPGPS